MKKTPKEKDGTSHSIPYTSKKAVSSTNERCIHNLKNIYHKFRQRRKYAQKMKKSPVYSNCILPHIEEYIKHAKKNTNKIYKDPIKEPIFFNQDTTFSNYKKTIICGSHFEAEKSFDVLNSNIGCICIDRFDTLVVLSGTKNMCSRCILFGEDLPCSSSKTDHINFILSINTDKLRYSSVIMPHFYQFAKSVISQYLVLTAEPPERIARLISRFTLEFIQNCPKMAYILFQVLDCLKRYACLDYSIKPHFKQTYSLPKKGFIVDTSNLYVLVEGYWHICESTLQNIRQIMDYPDTEQIVLEYLDHRKTRIHCKFNNALTQSSQTLIELTEEVDGPYINRPEYRQLEAQVLTLMENSISLQ